MSSLAISPARCAVTAALTLSPVLSGAWPAPGAKHQGLLMLLCWEGRWGRGSGSLSGSHSHFAFDVRPDADECGRRCLLVGALLGALVGAIMPASVQAASQLAVAGPDVTSALPPKPAGPTAAQPPKSARTVFFKTLVRGLLAKEVQNTGLPADVADAVVHVESDYNPDTIGSVGEIGLMQVRPETAAMLGFRGSNDDLAKPEVNLHYGVIYLSKAWRLANGDLCRALMKYRAGHGEEVMTPLSVEYCRRARMHLAALGSPFAVGGATEPVSAPALISTPASKPSLDSKSFDSKPSKPVTNSPTEVYARYRQGTAAASRAFWAAHDARVRAINARLEAKWRRVASR